MDKQKVKVNIAFIGGVDSGKSTICGFLTYHLGGLSEETKRKAEKDSIYFRVRDYKYVFLLDTDRSERERGITIRPKIRYIETNNSELTLIDCPGHRSYAKNTYRGLSLADVAFLVVSAAVWEFESGISREGNSRNHALYAYTIGIRNIIVGICKMDAVDYSKERYETIVTEVTSHLKKIGYDQKCITFIPFSNTSEANIIKKSEKIGWFEGPTVLEAIDNLKITHKYLQAPLRIPIYNIYRLDVGTVITGRVESGVLKANSDIKIAPINLLSKSVSLEIRRKKCEEAKEGDIVSILLKDVMHHQIKRGYVIGNRLLNPPQKVISFTASIYCIDYPTSISEGFTPTIFCNNFAVRCVFEKFIEKLGDRFNKREIPVSYNLKNNEAILVKLRPLCPITVEAFEDFDRLATFVIQYESRSAAIGVIKSVEKIIPFEEFCIEKFEYVFLPSKLSQKK